jgi:hypothetical protein
MIRVSDGRWRCRVVDWFVFRMEDACSEAAET